MYKKGELVVYGMGGVHIVDDITTMENTINGEDRLYYVLKSKMKNGGVSYVPVESQVYLRPVMSKTDAEELIKKIPQIPTREFENMPVRDAARVYRDALNTHNNETIIGLIKHITETSHKKREQNKKLSSVEERYLNLSKKILESELKEALCMDQQELENYILKHI